MTIIDAFNTEKIIKIGGKGLSLNTSFIGFRYITATINRTPMTKE